MAEKSTYKDIDIQLELKDRINYAFILQTTLLLIKRMMSKEDVEPQRIEDMMWDFLSDIPHDWMDAEFINDIKKSFLIRLVDARPLWGNVRLSIEKCKELNLPLEREITSMNPYLLKNAIVNLLHRRDMLVRKKKIEFSTGKNLDVKTLDDVEVYEDEKEELNSESVDDNIENEIKELEKEEKEE
jgi:hypothetical protein